MSFEAASFIVAIGEYAQAAHNGAARGLALAAENILAESNKRVPLDEGVLEGSGTVQVDAGSLTATIGYNTPYAIVQHEDMTLRHLNGREPKYLETGFNVGGKKVMPIVKAAIEGNL